MIAKNNIETYNIFNPRHMDECFIPVFDDELYSAKVVYGEKIKLGYKNRAKKSDKYVYLRFLSRYDNSGFQENDNGLKGIIVFKDLTLPWEINVAKAMKLAHGIIDDLNKSYPDRIFTANYDFNHNYIEMTIMINNKADDKRENIDQKKGETKRAIQLIKKLSTLYKEHPEFFSLSFNTVYIKGDVLEELGFHRHDFDEFIHYAHPIMSRNTNTGVFNTPFTPVTMNFVIPLDIPKIINTADIYMLDISDDDKVFLEYLKLEPMPVKPKIPESI